MKPKFVVNIVFHGKLLSNRAGFKTYAACYKNYIGMIESRVLIAKPPQLLFVRRAFC